MTVGIDRAMAEAVHVWWARLGDSHSLAALWPDVLDAEEQEQCRRFCRADDRDLYGLAHVLLRLALSQHAAVAPATWSFVRGAHGKPLLAPRHAAATRLHFSLAHSAGTAVCAIRHGAAIGVDIESVDRAIDPDEMAQGILAQSEQSALSAFAGDERRRRFLALWTLKEAYVKARGLGLSFPVSDCAFDLENRTVQVADHVAGDPGDWWFDHRMLEGRGLVSVAIPGSGSPPCRLHYRHMLLGPSNSAI